MRKNKTILLVLLICLLGFTVGAAEESASEAEENVAMEEKTVETIAINFVNDLNEGNFEPAFELFVPKLKSAMPLGKLQGFWNSITASNQLGEFQEILGSRVEKYAEGETKFDIVFTACKFENTIIDMRLVMNTDRKIAGMFLDTSKWNEDSSLYEKYSEQEDDSANKDEGIDK